MVVAIGGSPQVPVAQAISAGNDVELLLEFTPASYIVTADDLTVDSESVTVSVVEGSTNLVKLSVDPNASAGESFSVKFRQQVIVDGSVAVTKVWPAMYIGSGDPDSSSVELNFSFDDFDESTVAIIKIKAENYDYDAEFTYKTDSSLVCESDDLPESFGGHIELAIERADFSTWVSISGVADDEYECTVLSLDSGGQQIYP